MGHCFGIGLELKLLRPSPKGHLKKYRSVPVGSPSVLVFCVLIAIKFFDDLLAMFDSDDAGGEVVP